MSDSISDPAIQFYDHLRNYPDDPLEESDISKSRFLESFIEGTDQHSEIVNRLSISIPPHVKMGTKGSYVYGCLKPMADFDSAEDAACTPSCLRGFKTPDGSNCPFPVWERTEVGLIKLNDAYATKAYVYASLPLSSSEIDLLRSDGVETVIIFEQDGDTINYKDKTVLSIKDMGCPDTPLPPDNTVPCNTTTTTTSTTNSTASTRNVLIIIGVILFILLALCVFLFFQRSKTEEACCPPSAPAPAKMMYMPAPPASPVSTPVGPAPLPERASSPIMIKQLDIPDRVFDSWTVTREIDIYV